MKQKDIVLVIVMVFISAVISLLVSRWIFSSPQNRKQTAESVDVISADFTSPSLKYFNADSVNPTQQIQIGDSANPNPFNTKSE
jgi:hypothetical protein